ncbi:methyltransferase [Streptomyces sp. adm13(2018)]|uniref:methyltransferase n=1 Tax=Streptomyces sp. adm13(2018) TaxID=2479007 RepID=UPI0011CD36EB|nr:methyltransferase [Streptomyces sp. adm13(2018)]TXS05225.1 methyltransferase [Streptomyces sp. adm13(2018)]
MTSTTPVAPAAGVPTPTASADVERLRAAAAFVREQETSDLLARVLPGLDGPELRATAERCRFAHAALLVSPPDERVLRAELAAAGLSPDGEARPSVVVRERLAARHGLAAGELDVRIVRPAVHGPGGERRAVEVFVLTDPAGTAAAVAAEERTADREAHLAFDVERPDPLVLRGLRAGFLRYGARPDGGGYNPHEDGTVFYFAAPEETKTPYRRVELYARGDHRDVLAEHLVERGAAHPAETLLRLLTGAWTTQALAACAELRLPEAMSPSIARKAEELAPVVGARPENLATLLRHLAMSGVVAEAPGVGGAYRLTEAGLLLREDVEGSVRALALMYGGPFYESFGRLAHTVRTGQPGFEDRYGENHFDHFARDPELADRFDRSMTASAPMFDPLPEHPVVTAAAAAGGRTVVDIAGGTGELLGRLLTAHPALRGVLLERAHVVAAARDRLGALADRCAFRTGDFADVPSDGDVYVLSRVLHDWDDERCRTILRHCAAAMPPEADLLIVERLLPVDSAPSLATAWDLHMMCNTGGRERTAAAYAGLLADAGLTLVGHSPLPLEAHVLHARRG